MSNRTATLVNAVLVLLMTIVVALNQDDEANSGAFDNLREELRTISNTPGDLEFWMAYRRALLERGINPGDWQGGWLSSIGHGYLLLTGDDTGPVWRIHRNEKGFEELPKGIFIRFLTDDGLSEAVPDAEQLADTTIIVGTGPESMAITWVRSGHVSVIRTAHWKPPETTDESPEPDR